MSPAVRRIGALLVTTLLLDAAAVRAQATIGGAWREEVEAFAGRLGATACVRA